MLNEIEKEIEFAPNYCCIALLESCFFKCKMCHKWKTDIKLRDPNEPTLEQWKQFISDLSQNCSQKPKINFAGGEPLARQETLELMTFASDLGFDTLLATNAYLIDEQMAKNIGKAKVYCVSISLDSIDPGVHDNLRGKQGSYERVQEAISLLNKYAPNSEIDICTVISAVNLDGIIDLVKWVDRDKRISGVGFQAITQPFSTPIEDKWQENPEYSFLWPKDLLKTDFILDKLIELKSSDELINKDTIKTPAQQFRVYKNYFKNPESFLKKGSCHISVEAINVTPTGQVHICFYKPAIGNIKDSNIKEIWCSEKAKTTRKIISECTKNCQSLVNCNFEESETYID